MSDEDDTSAETMDTVREEAGTPQRRSRLGVGDLVPLALAVMVLAAGLVVWVRATHHDDQAVERAALRDEVLITARQHIETMNTLDHEDVEAGLQRWADVTTGMLHDQVTQADDEKRQLLADQEKVSVGSVIDAAVLDLTKDSATVLAAVEVTVKDDADPDAEPVVKRHRFSAELVKVDGAWLLEGLNQVSVSLS